MQVVAYAEWDCDGSGHVDYPEQKGAWYSDENGHCMADANVGGWNYGQGSITGNWQEGSGSCSAPSSSDWLSGTYGPFHCDALRQIPLTVDEIQDLIEQMGCLQKSPVHEAEKTMQLARAANHGGPPPAVVGPALAVLLLLSGCSTAVPEALPPPTSFTKSSRIESNFTNDGGIAGFALPVSSPVDVNFFGSDRYRLMPGMARFFFYVSVDQDVERYMHFTGGAGRYQSHEQDKANGTDTGECLDTTAVFPCPECSFDNGELELGIPRIPSGPTTIPAGRGWLVVIFTWSPYYDLSLQLDKPIAQGSWERLNVTGGSFRHDWLDADYQKFEDCPSGGTCGEVRGGTRDLAPHTGTLAIYAMYAVKFDYARLKGCLVDVEKRLPDLCAEAYGPTFPQSSDPGPTSLTLSETLWNGQQYDQLVLDANTTIWIGDNCHLSGNYFGVPFPDWPA